MAAFGSTPLHPLSSIGLISTVVIRLYRGFFSAKRMPSLG
jgi:hypothetical protein